MAYVDFVFDRCLAHIVNIVTQAVISTKSKSKHYDPHDPDTHIPDFTDSLRDELGLVRAISVKARSSSQRKDLFKRIQVRDRKTPSQQQPVQLLLDMKVRWGSTKVMLTRAHSLQAVSGC